MRWTSHSIELDLCSIKSNTHVVIYGIIPAIAAVIGTDRIGIALATTSAMTPTIADIVELVEASAHDTIIDGKYLAYSHSGTRNWSRCRCRDHRCWNRRDLWSRLCSCRRGGYLCRGNTLLYWDKHLVHVCGWTNKP